MCPLKSALGKVYLWKFNIFSRIRNGWWRALVESCEVIGTGHLIAGLGLITPKSIAKDLWRSTLNSTLIYAFPVPKTWGDLLELYVGIFISTGKISLSSKKELSILDSLWKCLNCIPDCTRVVSHIETSQCINQETTTLKYAAQVGSGSVRSAWKC